MSAVVCIGCGTHAIPGEVAWATLTLSVGDRTTVCALCADCQRLLRLSPQGLLVGAQSAIHRRFRVRVMAAWYALAGRPGNGPIGPADAPTASMAMAWDTLMAVGLDPAAVVRGLAPRVLGIPVCRTCGCTDLTPCDVGCGWVTADLCSACVANDPDAEEGIAHE